MATPKMVPEFLVGLWHRDYIKRANKNKEDGIFGPPQTNVQVWYLQTPFAFIDVRREPGTTKDAMAFAGVTTVELTDPPLVKWHACLDLDPLSDSAERWEQADKATPKLTEDEGFFTRLKENLYRETDPAKTLEEQWAKQHDGNKRLLAVRRDTSLFVVVGDHFGYAAQGGSNGNDQASPQFLAGHVEDWKVAISPSHLELEGSSFSLPGKQDDWHLLPGSTLELGSLDILFR
ncbi:unnamed protein product [Cylindrotheca closterium]|uniref:Uncharacterized protein n=1 Tax=Cylindrotheca closterium TaxID=2856 RepID=A0AAD2CPY4_9STRA|nr:unnamed protein product [Cylindrotheca closterium]